MTQNAKSPLIAAKFRKMNGLGNDFVVLDGRVRPLSVSPWEARAIADRQRGVGFDQLIVLEPSRNADLFMRILNADGSASSACGNATRCIGRLIMDETGRKEARIETEAGLLLARDAGAWNRVSVDMGAPRLGWRDIPLAREAADTGHVPFDASAFAPHLPGWFSAVNVGNPHAVFFVEDIEAQELGRIGPIIETHPLFPERVNVSLAKVVDPRNITLRVWERGAGLTRACGTAACAVGVAAFRAGLSERSVAISLPGGVLEIAWREDGHILMTGDLALDYEGELPASLFEEAASA